MRGRIVILAISASAMLGCAATAIAAERIPATIFRISANGASPDSALKDATQTISQVCAANGYVIVDNRIRQSADGSFYYGPVTAHCMA